MTKTRIILVTASLVLLAAVSSAQESTVSPYSIFGIGDLQLGESGRTSGMGSAALALQSGRFLNTANPASLAALDSTTFLFDFSASARGANFTSKGVSQKGFSANFTKLAFGTRITSRWSSALSMQPYSLVSYKIETEVPVEGSASTATTTYEGSGGISKVSFINSFRLSRNFTLGADMMILYGSIDKSERIFDYSNVETMKGAAFTTNMGLQYKGYLSQDVSLGIGLIYSIGTKMYLKRNLEVLDASGSVTYEDKLSSSKINIPYLYGGGFALSTRRFILAADYRFQNWSVTRDNLSKVWFTDTHTLNAGIAFTPAPTTATSYFELIQYQAGCTVSNSYLALKNVNPINYEITAGASLPFRSGSLLNVALGWGKRGTNEGNLIREDYMRLTICLSIAERWFMKRLYD